MHHPRRKGLQRPNLPFSTLEPRCLFEKQERHRRRKWMFRISTHSRDPRRYKIRNPIHQDPTMVLEIRQLHISTLVKVPIQIYPWGNLVMAICTQPPSSRSDVADVDCLCVL